MDVTQELIEQRDRIAGIGGYQWVKHVPIGEAETCAVMWGTTGLLSNQAARFLGDQMRVLLGDSAPDSIAHFNDGDASHEQILHLFDQAIKETLVQQQERHE